jgi:chromosome segregation ATPase
MPYMWRRAHPKPTNGDSFPPAKALAEIIDAKIASIDFGNEHKEANQSCLNLDDLIRKFENFINDPFDFAYEAIDYLKNVVQLKGEEELLRVSQNLHRILGKLDEYKVECKTKFAGKNKYSTKIENVRVEKEEARKELNMWLLKLNELKVDWREYERIKSESERMIKNFENKLMEIKFDIFPERFDEFRAEIEKDFGRFKIDPSFNLQ